MAIYSDDEILQDFLVEAGEILEQLGEQLVELEKRPTDTELLNAVFRGFHTIKGGAGFLGINALVEICHHAEDVFNILRQGGRVVDVGMMDVVLKVYDLASEMLILVGGGNEPASAPQDLLDQLSIIVRPDSTTGPEKNLGTAVANDSTLGAKAQDEGIDLVDQEFEKLLDTLDSKDEAEILEGQVQDSYIKDDNDEITDEEFEQILNSIHGEGQRVGNTTASEKGLSDVDGGVVAEGINAGESNEISEEEFEALLDKLHGNGSHRGAPQARKAEGEDTQGMISGQKDMAERQLTNEHRVEESRSAQPEKINQGDNKAKEPLHAQAEASVRVDTKRLDDIMNMVGELVLVRNRLSTLKASMGDEEILKTVDNLDLVTANLQAAVMQTRMQPLKKVFGRFPRVVRDLARTLGKEVVLELEGEETGLDKNLVEALSDPLVHLVRNSVDHGIETPDERIAAGKPPQGKIVLSAEQEGDHIILSIEDDGRGMDPQSLRGKAIEKGLIDEDAAARMDDDESYGLIFEPGFSTKEQISNVSGRGVGMDVVKTRITQLSGSIDVKSPMGKGTQIVIKVPLTLAIMPTLMVDLGSQIYALPLACINEIFDYQPTDTSTVDGRLVTLLRKKALPLLFLRNWVINKSLPEIKYEKGFVVVVSVGNQYIGCVVDQLVGQEEVVIKPLGAFLHGVKGVSGATITGNGRIALILDVPGLVTTYPQYM